MAYLKTFASVLVDVVRRLTENASHVLSPSYREFVSHFLAYRVDPRPLGALWGGSIDGGERIDPQAWHPIRAPIVPCPGVVQELFVQIQEEWDVHRADHIFKVDLWYRMEIDKLLAVFRHAAKCDECVVNVAHPPTNPERADRVLMPVRG